ncbi:MAG: serine/threonine protein kinase, partial [Bauldia sp.]|nr:serine/threonine protein kinase [Bauldia sp.]
MSAAPTIHAGAVLVGEAGILVRGRSGSGKSSLILALVAAAPKSTWLVADDRVALVAAHGRLVASVPAAIAGRLEIRGQGIVSLPFVSPVVIRLVVDLLPVALCPRLPSAEEARVDALGVTLPRLALPVGIARGAVRVRAALAHG